MSNFCALLCQANLNLNLAGKPLNNRLNLDMLSRRNLARHVYFAMPAHRLNRHPGV